MIEKAENTRRSNEWDVVKGVGILLVILGHTYGIPEGLHDFVYSFHMPLFFIVAGALYNPEKYSQYTFGQMVRKKARAYLLPYGIFAAINLALVILGDFILGKGFIGIHKVVSYITGILYCYADMQHMPNCTPIWFLMCLFWASLIFWALMKHSDKSYIIFCAAIMIVSRILAQTLSFRLPWSIGKVGMAVFFMGVGQAMSHFKLRWYNHTLLYILLGAAASIANEECIGMNENTYGNLLLYLIASLALSIGVIAICKKSLKDSVGLGWLGRNTMLVIGFNYFARDCSIEIYYMIPLIKDRMITWPISFVLTSVFLAGGMIIVNFWNCKREAKQLCRRNPAERV